ncbi:hypothetical protein GBAR_LOCUS27672 [Geodia barretti]|uniref:Uncharacterized protein n=1 Tax=Geodia barretti TaxID=519541 RepID=A0AA35TM33_GEOBA|nr:hypothetical protein GBAR_LOCUS27672 [Geodia barretti]
MNSHTLTHTRRCGWCVYIFLQYKVSKSVDTVVVCAYTSHPDEMSQKQAILWAEGDMCRGRDMPKLQSGKAEKIAKAEKLEKEAWLEKMERQEKLRSSMRAMDPLEAHMLRKITADMDTMIMSSKHKEFETESLCSELLPPYSEVDHQVGEGRGAVTQGDRLNALKRGRAHHHHSRIASAADRHTPEQILLMGRTRQQTIQLRKSAAAAAGAVVSTPHPPPPTSSSSSSTQLPATPHGKPMMTRSRQAPSRGVTVQALEPATAQTLPSIVTTNSTPSSHRPSRVRGNSSARTTVRPAVLATAGKRENL